MIKTIFSSHSQDLQKISNPRVVYQNALYPIINDANVKNFLEELIEGNYFEYLETGNYFRFKEDAEELFYALTQLLQTKTKIYLKDTSGSDIAKERSIFPDSIGKSFLLVLNAYPLLKTIVSIIKLHDLEKNISSDSLVEMYKKMDQESILAGEKPTLGFVDYDLQNEFYRGEVEKGAKIKKMLLLLTKSLYYKYKYSAPLDISTGIEVWDSYTGKASEVDALEKVIENILQKKSL